ncbi:MAG: hypothetical protein JJ866_27640, partial [Roseibium sp.]|uniref:hypothetical protein n=1 Tax=Roseibium sp. TaxID=1936156 RepID=UPI001B2522D7
MTAAPLILRDGRPVARQTMFSAAAALAKRLATSADGPIMPLCGRRRDLLVSVIAGQLAGREIILPPDDARSAIRSVLRQFGSALVLLSEDDPAVTGVT